MRRLTNRLRDKMGQAPILSRGLWIVNQIVLYDYANFKGYTKEGDQGDIIEKAL